MKGMYTGILIEESLTSRECLALLRIASTSIEQVTDRHRTPWVKQWTLHRFAIDDESAAPDVAVALQKALDPEHPAAWYVEFSNEREHYLVFSGRVFCIDRSEPAQYEAVAAYGLELGIPPTQLDFSGLT